MKYLKMYYFFAALLSICFGLQAQDRIYNKENKIADYEVKEITPAYIRGVNVSNARDAYSESPSNVLFIFNRMGNFLVLSKLFDDQAKADQYIKNFLLKDKGISGNTDKIITLKNDIIACSLLDDNEKSIEFVSNGQHVSLSKSEIALIIYKDGRHKLFSNINKTVKVLTAVQDRYNEIAFSALKTENHETPGYGKNVAYIPPASEMTKEKVQQSAGEAVKISPVPSFPNDNNKVVNANMQLDSVTLLSLQSKAIMNIKELETYLKIISDKDLDAGQVNSAIGQALSLFASEDAMIEVSSKNRSKVQLYNVKVYLNRLGFMKYSKVMIEWYNVQYVSKIRLNPDNSYSGIIEVQQKFTGMSGDKKIYEDITRKTVEIVLKSYNIKKGGENVKEWDVFLGNIGISVNDPQ